MANPIKNPHGPDQHGANDKGEHGHAGDNPQVSFERGDIDIIQITGFGIGLLIACMVTVFAMWALFEYFKGREDKVNRPAGGPMLFNLLPNAELVMTPHTGHWMQWERAELFNRLVIEFLESER